MFKFVTSTLINGSTYVDGSAAFVANETEKSLTLAHNCKFFKDNVTKITRAKYKLPVNDKLEIQIPSDISAGLYKIHMYIRSTENCDPLYANDFVYKGRPLDIEFVVKQGDSANTVANTIKRKANKWITLLFDNNKIINVDASNNKVILTATSEYQRFFTVEIMKFDENLNKFAYDGAFKTVYSMDPESDEYASNVFTLTKGNVGFLTYDYMMQNVRLATNANWMKGHPLRKYQVDEIPSVNGKYWEYVFTQCTERPEMQGTSVLGQYNKSITTHVVYVEDGVKSAFETELVKVFGTLSDDKAVAGANENNTKTVFDSSKPAAESASELGD